MSPMLASTSSRAARVNEPMDLSLEHEVGAREESTYWILLFLLVDFESNQSLNSGLNGETDRNSD